MSVELLASPLGSSGAVDSGAVGSGAVGSGAVGSGALELPIASRVVPIQPDQTSLVLQQPIVERLYACGCLLARAMEQDVSESMCDSGKPNFRTYKQEIELMRNKQFKNASCTLLVSQCAVATYKPYGFLFNGGSANILHVAKGDSNSCVDAGGNVRAAKSDLSSLKELEQFIRGTDQRPLMNEVNANFVIEDLVGLFVLNVRNKLPEIEIILVQRWMKEQGIDLPLFRYDAQQGTLTLIATDDQGHLRMLCNGTPNYMKPLLKQALEV